MAKDPISLGRQSLIGQISDKKEWNELETTHGRRVVKFFKPILIRMQWKFRKFNNFMLTVDRPLKPYGGHKKIPDDSVQLRGPRSNRR